MDQDQLRSLLEQVRSGAVEVDAAVDRMRHMPFEDLGFAKVDHHRALRHGMPEVVFAQGKTPEQVAAIAERLLEHSANVLITRADRECAEAVDGKLPGGEYFPAFPARSGSGATAPCAARARWPWCAPEPATCRWPRRRASRRR